MARLDPSTQCRIGSVAFAVLLSSNMQKGEKMHIFDDNLYFHICYSLADFFFGCLLKVICTLKQPLQVVLSSESYQQQHYNDPNEYEHLLYFICVVLSLDPCNRGTSK